MQKPEARNFTRWPTPLVWLVAGAALLLILSCGYPAGVAVRQAADMATGMGAGSMPVAPDAPDGALPPVDNGPQEPDLPPAQIGQRIEQGGVALTVLTAERTAQVGPFEAEAGNSYVVLDVVLENVAAEEITPVFGFTLLDSSGTSYDSSMLSAPELTDMLGADPLAAGEQARGKAVFEVPEGASGLVLNYEPLEFFMEDVPPIQVALDETAVAAGDPEEPAPGEPAPEEPAPEEPAPEEPTTAPEAPAPQETTPTPTEEPPPLPPTEAPTATSEPLPTTTPVPPVGEINTGGNLREAPDPVGGAVIAQMCAGDQVEFLERQGNWYRIRVLETGDDCSYDRAEVGAEGWISTLLVDAPDEEIPAPTEPGDTAEPSGEPAEGTAEVINGGNLRSEPRIAAETVIGQVCPGDMVDLLEQQESDGITWHRVRVTTLAEDCVPERVAVDTEGWLSSVLLTIP